MEHTEATSGAQSPAKRDPSQARVIHHQESAPWATMYQFKSEGSAPTGYGTCGWAAGYRVGTGGLGWRGIGGAHSTAAGTGAQAPRALECVLVMFAHVGLVEGGVLVMFAHVGLVEGGRRR